MLQGIHRHSTGFQGHSRELRRVSGDYTSIPVVLKGFRRRSNKIQGCSREFQGGPRGIGDVPRCSGGLEAPRADLGSKSAPESVNGCKGRSKGPQGKGGIPWAVERVSGGVP